MTRRLSFSEALDAVKEGALVQRAGWNGQNMFIFLVGGSRFEVNRPPLNEIFNEGTEIEYHGHIDMKTAQGYVVPWVASHADLLSEDWRIIELADPGDPKSVANPIGHDGPDPMFGDE